MIVNNLTSSSILKVITVDDSDDNNRVERDLSFSVAIQGVEFGDSSCSVFVVAEDVLNDTVLNPDITNNALTNTLTTLDQDTLKTNMGVTTIWLIFMGAIGFFIWMNKGVNDDATHTFGVIAIIEVIGLFIGMKMGYLGVGSLMTVLIVALGVIAIQFRKGSMGA